MSLRTLLTSSGRATVLLSAGSSYLTALLHTRCTLKQLILQDRDWIEPVERLWFRTVCVAHSIVPFAEIPESDGVIVVKTQCLGNGIDEDRVGYVDRYYIGQVQSNEVYFAQYGSDFSASQLHEDNEDQRYK